MDKTIRIECTTKDRLPIGDLREFQGNLKTLTEVNFNKLKAMILKLGFSFPIFVWPSAEGNFILDGHQRLRVLQKLRDDGYEIPDIPVVKVNADSYKEAKDKLLSAASNYGDVDKAGLYEFIHENGIEPDHLYENFKLPDINFENFHKEFFDMPTPPDYGDKNKELGEDEFSQFEHTCPKCGFQWDGGKKK